MSTLIGSDGAVINNGQITYTAIKRIPPQYQEALKEAGKTRDMPMIEAIEQALRQQFGEFTQRAVL